MKIEDFKMKVNSEQSKIIQEILFKNGCRWIDGSVGILDYTGNSLFLDRNISSWGLRDETYNDSRLNELTFEEFMEKYSNSNENQSIIKVTTELNKLLQHKNTKYGNAALEPLRIFDNKCKAGHNIDQKLSRIKNSTSLNKNDVVDLMGYLALTCIEMGWDDFSDLYE